jgi:hypothetical protein
MADKKQFHKIGDAMRWLDQSQYGTDTYLRQYQKETRIIHAAGPIERPLTFDLPFDRITGHDTKIAGRFVTLVYKSSRWCMRPLWWNTFDELKTMEPTEVTTSRKAGYSCPICGWGGIAKWMFGPVAHIYTCDDCGQAYPTMEDFKDD